MGRSSRLATRCDRRRGRRRTGRAESPRGVDRAGDRGDPARRAKRDRGSGRGRCCPSPAAPGSSPSASPSSRRRRRRSRPFPTATARGGSSSRPSARRATASRRATLATAPDAVPAFTVAATLPALSGRRPRRPGHRRRLDPAAAGLALRRVPASGSGPSGTLHVADAGDRAGARQTPAGASKLLRRGAAEALDARPARAGGGPRRRDPHRPARPRRPRPRRGVHDGRRQPRRRDLRLEHRDRRGGHRRDDRPSRAPTPVGRDDRRDRRLRGVRRRIGLGRPRGADGRRRAAGARDRASGPRGRRARLGRHAPARLGPGAHRRRRLPALVAGDGRTDRLGDAAHRVARGVSGGGRLPGWLAESLGVSLAAQAATLPIILVSFGRLAVLSPLVNLLVVPLVAPAMAAGVARAGGRRRGRRRGAAGPRGRRRGARLGRPADPRHRSSTRRRACRSRASRSSRRSTSRRPRCRSPGSRA